MKLTKEILEKLEKLPTGNVADSCQDNPVMDSGIKPLDSTLHLIGRAVTVKCTAGDNLALHQGIEAAGEGDVLVFDCDSYTEAGHFGDMMATSCKGRGIAGIVIDGSCRDSQDIIKLKYPVFSRGSNPATTTKEILGQINVPVVVGGVNVKPGDIIFGDCDGVVVVPQEVEDEVFEKAMTKYTKEQKIVQELAKGQSTLSYYHFDDVVREKISQTR